MMGLAKLVLSGGVESRGSSKKKSETGHIGKTSGSANPGKIQSGRNLREPDLTREPPGAAVLD